MGVSMRRKLEVRICYQTGFKARCAQEDKTGSKLRSTQRSLGTVWNLLEPTVHTHFSQREQIKQAK